MGALLVPWLRPVPAEMEPFFTGPNNKQLRTAIKARWGYLGDPTGQNLFAILENLGDLPLEPFLKRLNDMSSFFVAGKGKATSFDFFEREAKSYRNERVANARINGWSKSKCCVHGLDDGECTQCLPRAEQKWMTDTLDAAADIDAPRPIDHARRREAS